MVVAASAARADMYRPIGCRAGTRPGRFAAAGAAVRNDLCDNGRTQRRRRMVPGGGNLPEAFSRLPADLSAVAARFAVDRVVCVGPRPGPGRHPGGLLWTGHGD